MAKSSVAQLAFTLWTKQAQIVFQRGIFLLVITFENMHFSWAEAVF